MMDELFKEEDMYPWKAEWQGMPEYEHADLQPKFQVLVSFACESDLLQFCEVIGKRIPPSEGRQTKSIWFPDAEIGRYANKRYIVKS